MTKIWCAARKCKKNQRLDTRPKSQYFRVSSKEVLEKIRKLNEEVMMGDFVCVDCRYLAQELFLKQQESDSRENEANNDLSDEDEEEDLIEIPNLDENDAFDLDDSNQLNNEDLDDHEDENNNNSFSEKYLEFIFIAY